MNQKFNKAIIFINGDEPDLTYAGDLIDDHTFIIGCDGGTDKLHNLGLKPHAVIGDFDSVKNLPRKIKNLPLKHYGKELVVNETVYIKYPTDKDFLDIEAAIDYALQKGIKDIVLVNTEGNEPDHILGVFMLLAKRKHSSVNLKIIRSKMKIYIARNNTEINGKAGDKISLIPLYGRVDVSSSTGLKYDPAKHQMSPEHNIGISNELTNKKATLNINKGCFLVVHYC